MHPQISTNKSRGFWIKIVIISILILVLITCCFFLFKLFYRNGLWGYVPPTIAKYMAIMKTPGPNIGDGGFITRQPCGPPCYQNISPGVTTEKDARNILQNMGEPCVDFDYTNEGGYRGLICENVTMGFVNHIVDALTFYPSTAITVQQVIEAYGPPDRVCAYISSILPDEPQRSNMMLFYDRFQAILELTEQDGIEFKVNPSTGVSSIGYLTEADYQYHQNLLVDNVSPWNSYERYSTDETNP